MSEHAIQGLLDRTLLIRTADLWADLWADTFATVDVIEDWQARALCAQTDPEAFFPEKGGSTREAKRVCAGCEVRAECLEFALEHDERFGVWGGLSERERRPLRHIAFSASVLTPDSSEDDFSHRDATGRVECTRLGQDEEAGHDGDRAAVWS